MLINSKQSPQNAQPPPCCRGRSPPLSCTSPRLQTSSSRRPGRYQTPWDTLSLYIVLHECSFPALMDSPAEANHACSSEKTLAGCVHSPTVRVQKLPATVMLRPLGHWRCAGSGSICGDLLSTLLSPGHASSGSTDAALCPLLVT